MAFHQFIKTPFAVNIHSNNKEGALNELATVLLKKLEIRKRKPIIDDCLKREESASTFVGSGIAIPQTKATIKEEFAIAVGRSLDGINWDAARGALAHIIVLVIIREDADPDKHIQILSEVSSCFKSDVVQERILAPVHYVNVLKAISAPVEIPAQKLARKESNPLIKSALQLTKDIKAAAIMVFADSVRDNSFLDYFTKQKAGLFIVTSNKARFESDDKRIRAILQAPPFPFSRTGQIKIGILLALSRNLISNKDKVVCISGTSQSGVFDTVVTLDIEKEYEYFFTAPRSIIPADVKPEVLERILGIASELAVEGREGKPTGTIFVVGDTNSVNAYVRQLIINPFRGYSEAERNILDPGLEETIKEFSAIDGAFIITGDGIIVSAGSYLRPQAQEIETLPGGFGARHAAAAGISACTNALAITVSESTGLMTVFKNGSIVLTVSKPMTREHITIQHKM